VARHRRTAPTLQQLDFGVVSSLWLDIGAQRRHYNNWIQALPMDDFPFAKDGLVAYV
jgi:hypothetical protein